MTAEEYYNAAIEAIGACIEHLQAITVTVDALLIVAVGAVLYALFWRWKS